MSRGVDPGHRLPPFAMPLALGRLDADANVATRAGQGQRGRRAACDVRGPGILNICQLEAGAPVVLAFVATRAGSCAAQLDIFPAALTAERFQVRHDQLQPLVAEGQRCTGVTKRQAHPSAAG